MLLIHGAGSSAAAWPADVLALPGIRTVAVDLPGHGQSPRPGRRTIRHYAAAVAAFVASMDVDEVIVVGHSMGGAIALELAVGGWAWLRGLVLLGSSSRLPVAPSLFATISRDFAEAAATISELSYGPDAPAAWREATAATMLACGAVTTTGDLLACNAFNRTAALPDLALPALVISGSADRMVPNRHSAATASALPNATLETIDGAGHFVMQEAPEDVARLLAAFHRQVAGHG